MTTNTTRKNGNSNPAAKARQSVGSAELPPPLGPEQFARFFAQARELLCITNLDGQIRDLNPLWEQLLGYTRAELLALRLEQLVHPDDRADTASLLGDLPAGGASFENRCQAKDGSYHWLRWSASADASEGLLFLSARTNGAERQDAEDLALYRALCDHLPLGVHIHHLKDEADPTSLTVVNANTASIAFANGVDLRERVGEPLGTVFPGLNDTPIPGIYAQAARSGQMYDLGEIPYSDSVVSGWFAIHAVPLPNRHVAVVFENTTEKRRSIEELQLYREICEQIPTGLGIYRVENIDDPTSIRVVTCNPAAVNFLGGIDLRKHADKPIGELFPSIHQTGVLELYAQVARTGKIYDFGDMPYNDAALSGWFSSKAFPLPNQTIGIAFENVTERKRAEEGMRLSILQEETIRAQQATLAELTTPLLAISEHTVVMPLIGTIDSRRAQQVMEALLEGVAARQAHAAILDITGVSIVDTQVANALIRAAQAVRLLGANVILTGIRPEVAQTLVGLGVDLSGVITRGTLQSGIAYALAMG